MYTYLVEQKSTSIRKWKMTRTRTQFEANQKGTPTIKIFKIRPSHTYLIKCELWIEFFDLVIQNGHLGLWMMMVGMNKSLDHPKLIQKMNFQDCKILKMLTKIVFMGLWLPRRHCFKKGCRDEAKSWLEKLRPTTLQ